MNDVQDVVEIDADCLASITPLQLRGDLQINDPGLSVHLAVGGTDLALRWGQPHHLGSCAYWIDQTKQTTVVPRRHALGRSLREEVAACLLGGYGVPAEIGLSAFRQLLDRGVLAEGRVPSRAALERILVEPLSLAGGRRVRYRFPKQRAHRLAVALEALSAEMPPDDPLALREWLMQLPGIGPKTASWIVRNRTSSGTVAIIDVHVRRAGIAAGFFHDWWHLPRDYPLFERAFVAVSRLGGVSPADLDACIWGQLHTLGPAGRFLLGKPAALFPAREPEGYARLR